MRFNYEDFIAESNRIERIFRDPSKKEKDEFLRFMKLDQLTVEELQRFVSVYQPDAQLRNRAGLNVRVGMHLPPAGGPKIKVKLDLLLKVANADRGYPHGAYAIHHDYETLHPFTDGNGRSGRMVWMWMMRQAPLGFLHTWYYQSLQYEHEEIL